LSAQGKSARFPSSNSAQTLPTTPFGARLLSYSRFAEFRLMPNAANRVAILRGRPPDPIFAPIPTGFPTPRLPPVADVHIAFD
jgi:hypothetical protein